MVLRPLSKMSSHRKDAIYNVLVSRGFKYLLSYLKYLLFTDIGKAMKQRDKDELLELAGQMKLIDKMGNLKGNIRSVTEDIKSEN